MRKGLGYAVGLILIIAAAAAVTAARHQSQDHTDKNKAANTPAADHSIAFPVRQACAIFTLAEAKQVLGDSAKGGQSGTNTSSEDMAVSSCSYKQDAGSNATVSSQKAASLKVSSPKSGKGTTSNQNQFGPLKPVDAQLVSNYGDNAYWDPQLGQLNILKNNTWYILSSGPTTPSSRTLDEAKQLADLLIAKM